jgi:two-component system phosphate regulon response regulator OmpR
MNAQITPMMETMSAALPHILVVDDDARLRELLRRFLTDHALLVTTAAGAAEARALLPLLSYDLMILDVMMPGENGLELARSLRQTAPTQQLPILLLTARGETSDRIDGLETGADDYLVKPFEPRELLLRINAILRRTAKPAPTRETVAEIRLGRWRFDSARDSLISGEENVRLTEMEAGLLRVMAAEPGVAISRELLAERSKTAVNDRTIDVQITRLRRKIELDAKSPRYIITVRGEGYMLVPDGVTTPVLTSLIAGGEGR